MINVTYINGGGHLGFVAPRSLQI